jgi:hypothetical protein
MVTHVTSPLPGAANEAALRIDGGMVKNGF